MPALTVATRMTNAANATAPAAASTSTSSNTNTTTMMMSTSTTRTWAQRVATMERSHSQSQSNTTTHMLNTNTAATAASAPSTPQSSPVTTMDAIEYELFGFEPMVSAMSTISEASNEYEYESEDSFAVINAESSESDDEFDDDATPISSASNYSWPATPVEEETKTEAETEATEEEQECITNTNEDEDVPSFDDTSSDEDEDEDEAEDGDADNAYDFSVYTATGTARSNFYTRRAQRAQYGRGRLCGSTLTRLKNDHSIREQLVTKPLSAAEIHQRRRQATRMRNLPLPSEEYLAEKRFPRVPGPYDEPHEESTKVVKALEPARWNRDVHRANEYHQASENRWCHCRHCNADADLPDSPEPILPSATRRRIHTQHQRVPLGVRLCTTGFKRVLLQRLVTKQFVKQREALQATSRQGTKFNKKNKYHKAIKHINSQAINFRNNWNGTNVYQWLAEQELQSTSTSTNTTSSVTRRSLRLTSKSGPKLLKSVSSSATNATPSPQPLSPTLPFSQFRRRFYSLYRRDIEKSLDPLRGTRVVRVREAPVSRQVSEAFMTKYAMTTPRYTEPESKSSRAMLERLQPRVSFHGTSSSNFPSILSRGFLLPGKVYSDGMVVGVRGRGAHGDGIYSYGSAGYPLGFTRGSNTMLVCAVATAPNASNNPIPAFRTPSTPPFQSYRRLHYPRTIHGITYGRSGAIRHGFNSMKHGRAPVSQVKFYNNMIIVFEESRIVPLFYLDFETLSNTQLRKFLCNPSSMAALSGNGSTSKSQLFSEKYTKSIMRPMKDAFDSKRLVRAVNQRMNIATRTARIQF